MLAHEVSAYSLTAVTRRALPLMEGRDGSVVTLTYLGGDRVVPNYNVMGVAKAALEATTRYLASNLGPRGIRVNAISAGPIKTPDRPGTAKISSMFSMAVRDSIITSASSSPSGFSGQTSER